MSYYNFYAVKAKKLSEALRCPVKVADKDANFIFLDVDGQTVAVERMRLRTKPLEQVIQYINHYVTTSPSPKISRAD